MNTFGHNDTVFASATRMGKELFSVCLCGVNSKESLIDFIRSQRTRGLGLMNLRVRNMTQGWTSTMALY